MIHEILPSDVEFARGMINAGHSDEEIVSHLTSRSLERAKAAELLQDLRQGRSPPVQLAYVPEAGMRHGHRRHRATRPVEAHPQRRSSRGRHGRRRFSWWFLLMLVIFAWALGYAYLHLGSDASRDVISRNKHEIPPAPDKP
jgi:hypothetical protein